MARQKKVESIEGAPVVQPLIRSNGEKHILEEMFEDPLADMPVMKAIGYMSLKYGPNSWVSYTVTFKGDKVLKIEVDEPNLRPIAEESAKIAFVEQFIDQEL